MRESAASPDRRGQNDGVRCLNCHNPLVTVGYGRRCAVCGKQASLLRAVGSNGTWTQSGAEKVLARKSGLHPSILREQQSAPSTWQQAEMVACQWMQANGFRDARLTPPGADGGVDVESRAAIAQVKFHQKPVGLSEMQRIYGIAQSTGKRPFFFSSAGYTPKALQWARAHGIETHSLGPIRRVR